MGRQLTDQFSSIFLSGFDAITPIEHPVGVDCHQDAARVGVDQVLVVPRIIFYLFLSNFFKKGWSKFRLKYDVNCFS